MVSLLIIPLKPNTVQQAPSSAMTTTGAGGSITIKPPGVLHTIATLIIHLTKQAIIASKTLKHKSKLPPTKPKKLISSISNKAMRLCQRKKTAGDDGVWRREILMGDKCQPLDFSGVIYYDKDGKLLSEVPMRSPRASPLPGYAFAPAKSGWTTPAR